MGLYLNPGNETFAELVQADIYVDKTGLIAYMNGCIGKAKHLIASSRPRRFGKTLAAQMLTSYYSKGCDSSEVFSNLEIAKDKSFELHLNKYDVISLDIQWMRGVAIGKIQEGENTTVLGYIQSEILKELRQEYPQYVNEKENSVAATLANINQETKKKFIIIIDEWDCVFREDKENLALQSEYINFLRSLFKGGPADRFVKLAYITGILPIKKYGTQSALNNFRELTMTSPGGIAKYIGFTEAEVKVLCKEHDMPFTEMKKWYDGYHFGDFDVYCPWDVMNYMLELQHNPKAKPISYWKNTSDNAIIRSFIDYAGSTITKKLETLMAGGCIVQRVDENLTYDYLHSSEDNLWSTLYLTGYLTRAREEDYTGEVPDGMVALMIPNAEINEIFETTVIKWFDDSAKKWNRNALFDAVFSGDSEGINREMNALLRRTISYHDYREDFYHAFLAGIFTGAGYMVDSNKEHGEGRSDVVVYDPINARVAIFEAKYTKTLGNLEKDCDTALQQIDDRMYAKEYEDDYDQIFCYGISFFKKRCMVKEKG